MTISPALKKNDYLLVAALLNFFILLTLYQFRAIDDNRLTSWNWVFDGTDVTMFYLLILISMIAACFLSKIAIAKRWRGFFLFVSSFIVCIFFWKEPEVIVDASRYFTQAKHLEIYGLKYFIHEWGKGIEAWTDLPFVPLIYGLIFRFFGESRSFIQIFNSLIFSSSVLLTFHIGRILWDEERGFIAGMLLMGIPYIYTQVPLMLVDVPAMFFLTFSVVTFIKAVNNGKGWLLFSATSIVAAVFTKYSTWMMLSVIAVIFFVCMIDKTWEDGACAEAATRKKRFFRGSIVLLLSVLFAGIVFWKNHDVMLGQITLLQEYQSPGLKRWGESYFSTFFFQIHPFISIAALYSLFVAIRKKDLKYLIICWLIAIIFVLQIKRIRYTLPAFPMLALMASYGLTGIREKQVRHFLVLCAVLSSLVLSIFIFNPFLQRMSEVNLMDAGRFLDAADIRTAEVLTIPSEDWVVNSAVAVPLLDLFTDTKINFKYIPENIPLDKIEESSLRFSWRYKNPDYYSVNNTNDNGGPMLVVISSESGQIMPDRFLTMTEGRSLVRIFNRSTGIFNYNTEVKIFR